MGPEFSGLLTDSFAEVALDVPLRAGDRVFTFAIPSALALTVEVGLPVRVPFGRRVRTGFVVGMSRSTTHQVKPIIGVDEGVPSLPADLVSLAWWMADYYVCSVGEAIAVMIPALAELTVTHRRRSPPAWDPASPPPPKVPLGDGAALRPYLTGATPARVLAIGGEARVAVYAEALQWATRRNLGIIVLAPEISQAEWHASWIRDRIRRPLAVVHGALSAEARWESWRRVRAGDTRIVVGTRVAVFSPVRDLGLIVLDREDDPSYKEERAPHYDARRVAEERARSATAGLIWGTLTPSVEIAQQVEERRVVQIATGPRSRPRIALVDLRSKGRSRTLLSPVLHAAIARLLPGGTVILFVPRRGYADFLLCHECGYVPRCPRCNVALTFFRRGAALRCSLCGRIDPAPDLCPSCHGTDLRPHGVGTERIETEVRRLFPGTPVLRLDRDAAPTEEAQRRTWRRFAAEGGMLVGTQLLTKGIGQCPATLVGAMGVDGILHVPDFRADERAYQVLTQLAGLAKREMLIETFAPAHPALRAVLQQDPRPFYRAQLAARERAGYPPYRTLVNVVVSGAQEGPVRQTAERIAEMLAGSGEVLGPAPSPQGRRRGQVRWQILVKESPTIPIRPRLREMQISLRIPRGLRLMIDVDPVDLA